MAGILDIDINEGDTFIMAMEFWSDCDNTIPIDITASTFIGNMKLGQTLIPMTMTISGVANNVLEAKIDYLLLADIPSAGNYDIVEEDVVGERFRTLQGTVTVSKDVA